MGSTSGGLFANSAAGGSGGLFGSSTQPASGGKPTKSFLLFCVMRALSKILKTEFAIFPCPSIPYSQQQLFECKATLLCTNVVLCLHPFTETKYCYRIEMVFYIDFEKR